jgi:hypothetical protein
MSAARNADFLERLIILDHNFGATDLSFGMDWLINLRVFEGYELSAATSVNVVYERIGDVRDSNFNPIDFDFRDAGTLATNVFNSSRITQTGDLVFPTTAHRTFINCYDLEVVGDFDFETKSGTTFTDVFYNCYNLRKIGTISTTASMTTMATAFRFCQRLQDIIITDCAGVTTTTNTFVFTASIKTLHLSGITVSFDVSDNDMEAEDINDLFTSLGTAAGSQTVTVTGNPGASTCDTSIATGKGWTVAT